MRKLALLTILAGSAGLAACATYPARPTAAQVASACGSYGYVDSNNDGFVSSDEWASYRTGTYSHWDTDRDGRISQTEFQNCWYGGGFYRDAYYNRDYWNSYWSGFDANGDGYLTNEEYWSASAYARLDANKNGRIDAEEYVWPR